MPAGASQSENHARAGFPKGILAKFVRESAVLRKYLWKYRWYVTIGLLALVITDALEVIPPWLLKLAVDIATASRPRELLFWVIVGYLATAVVQAIGRYCWRMYLIRASMYAGRDIRASFAEHVFGLSQSFFDRTPIGELMSLITSDVEAIRTMLGSGLLIFADSIFYFLTVPVVMYLLSPKLTLLAFIPLPVLPWLVLRNEREIHERYEKVQEQFGVVSAMTQESLNGVRVLKGFAREGAQTERFRKECDKFLDLNLRLARVQTSFGPTLEFAMSIGMVLLLYVGGRELIQNGSTAQAITLGTFVAFQRYIQKMVWPMAALGMALGTYQRSASSSNRLDEIYEKRTDVPESMAAVAPKNTEGRIELRKLSFTFPGTDRKVLDSIDLTIEPGERISFVGTIGSGKSALLSLLPRLYPVSDGMLLIDGIDINRWRLDELRRAIGYVGQDVFLFSESVLENLAYSLANSARASGDRNMAPTGVAEATRIACVHDEIKGLSKGYETRVGERGVGLSGGQKQRLTIARAILKQPPILILDDALSSVDVHTEEKILTSLRSRPGRNTELIAAHRISTIRDADRIIVLDQGRILQQGTHQVLMSQRSGLYHRFVTQQQLREELEAYSDTLAPELAT